MSVTGVSAISVSAATPAAEETGLALNVPGWPIFSLPAAFIAAKSRMSRMSLRPATHAPGIPPATIFAKLERSGRMPYSTCAPPEDTRNPVTTSSKISSVPVASVTRRSSCRNSGRIGTCPKLDPVGSRMTAATARPASALVTASMSPGGTSTTFSAMPGMTPVVAEPSKWSV